MEILDQACRAVDLFRPLDEPERLQDLFSR